MRRSPEQIAADKAARAQREAAALRANLARRKAQQRARAAGEAPQPQPSPKPEAKPCP